MSELELPTSTFYKQRPTGAWAETPAKDLNVGDNVRVILDGLMYDTTINATTDETIGYAVNLDVRDWSGRIV